MESNTVTVFPSYRIQPSQSGTWVIVKGPALDTGVARCSSCWAEVCPDCGKCHRHSVRTQKARGLLAYGGNNSLPIRAIIPVACKNWAHGVSPDLFTSAIFARPCPMRPRHGFVESRKITSMDELVALVEETRAADPEGEIMLTPLINAAWNAIWAPGQITLGPGHDGATGGKAGTFSIPLVDVYRADCFTSCGIAKGEVPFIEVVGKEDGSFTVTQVRSGPKVAGMRRDYVPKQVSVKRVVEFNPSLSFIDWERIVEGLGEGDVIYHPNASITDHASIHARLRGVPLVTFPIEVGSVLTPTPTEPAPSPEAVLRGVAWGEAVMLDHNYANATRMILLGLHHSSAMSGEDGKWIGLAAALMLRLGSMALRGEARHERGLSKNGKAGRDSVYTRHKDHPLSYHRAGVSRLLNLFRYGDFGHGTICGSGGTGGVKWAACAYSLIPLFNAVRELALDPSDQHVKDLIGALNDAVNKAHNNGWWLNKFLPNTAAFAQIPKGYHEEILPILPWIWTVRSTTGREWERYKKWPVTRMVTPKPSSIALTPLPNGIAVSMTVKGYKKPLYVPVPLSSVTAILSKLIKIDHGEGKYRILQRGGLRKAGSKDGKVPTLWEEPDLSKIGMDK